MAKVPVSMEDKQKSYFKYYMRDMTAPAPEKLALIGEEPNDPKTALPIQERSRMFEMGELPGEFGWWRMPDGTAMIANETAFPGTTGEMFDWWFAWHPLDRLRYAIWDPFDHYDVRLDDPKKGRDMSLTMQERHWGSLHHIWESLEPGTPDMLWAHFQRPRDMGYDESKIGTASCSALICANSMVCGNGDTPDASVVMLHFLRPVEGGAVLRSRFWFGYQIIAGKAVKLLPDGARIPDVAPRSLLKHNVIEFTNLAAILPSVYAEEKDNW